ncbi:MAG: hypothetical protein ABFR50_08685 [Candidatus Fermentibacteria bacterium]
MNYPECPSCGNELFDKTDQCPFCGTDLPRRVFHPAAMSKKPQLKLAILIGAMMLITGAVSIFIFIMRSDIAASGKEKTIEEVIPQDTDAQHCLENMYRILDAEDDYLDQNGHYTDNIDELHRFDSALDILCPETGQPYSIMDMKHSVEVICSVHGDI